MPYQSASLPRPAATSRPESPVVPIGRVRPEPPPVRRLERRLAETEVALAAAAREARRWEERARALQVALSRTGAAAARAPVEPALPASLPPALAACVVMVAGAAGIGPSELLGRSRRLRVARARQILYFAARRSTALSLAAIGAAFGRDHSTVLHGIRRCALVLRVLGVATKGSTEDIIRALVEADWTAIAR